MFISLNILLILLCSVANPISAANTTTNTIIIHNNCEAIIRPKIYDVITVPLSENSTYIAHIRTDTVINMGISEFETSIEFDSFMVASTFDVYDSNGEMLPRLSIEDISDVVTDIDMTNKFYAFTDYDELWFCVPNVDIENKPPQTKFLINIVNLCDYDVYIGQAIYSYDIYSPVEMICKPQKRLVAGGSIELPIGFAPGIITLFSAYNTIGNTNVDVSFLNFVSTGMTINRIIETTKPTVECDGYITRGEQFYFYHAHYIPETATLCG